MIISIGQSSVKADLYLVLKKNPVAVDKILMHMIFIFKILEEKSPIRANWKKMLSSNYEKQIRLLEGTFRKLFWLNLSMFLIVLTIAKTLPCIFFTNLHTTDGVV